MQAYFNLPSDYEVRPEFRHSIINFEADYLMKPQEEKTVVKRSLLNQLIQPGRYQDVLSYRAGPCAIEKSRQKVQIMANGGQSDIVADTPSHSYESVLFKLMENVGGDLEAMRGTVTKSMEIFKEKKVRCY